MDLSSLFFMDQISLHASSPWISEIQKSWISFQASSPWISLRAFVLCSAQS
ncbi:unnamed protein product, partial [Arabidopsis halleri]